MESPFIMVEYTESLVADSGYDPEVGSEAHKSLLPDLASENGKDDSGFTSRCFL